MSEPTVQEVKPPFSIPSMASINANKGWANLNAVSTFSGCGGNSTGLKLAGFNVRWASEFIPEAQNTYRANHPGTILDTRDIRLVKPEEILEAIGMKRGELDMFDSSPPCKSFSTSGKRDKGWGEAHAYSDGVVQRTDDLFFEFIRILNGLQPRVFAAENVTGLVKGTARGMFKEFLAAMQSCGYRVKAVNLNGAYCRTPQARERIFYLGVRNDLNIEPSFPAPSYGYTAREALAGLKLTDEDIAECVHLKPGHYLYKAWHATVPGDNFIAATKRFKGTDSYFDYRRLGWHRPAPTIKATPGGLYHPDEPRSLAIKELKRLSTLPDDFVLTGSYEQQWERCGRLVPPLMYKYLADHIRDHILRRSD